MPKRHAAILTIALGLVATGSSLAADGDRPAIGLRWEGHTIPTVAGTSEACTTRPCHSARRRRLPVRAGERITILSDQPLRRVQAQLGRVTRALYVPIGEPATAQLAVRGHWRLTLPSDLGRANVIDLAVVTASGTTLEYYAFLSR